MKAVEANNSHVNEERILFARTFVKGSREVESGLCSESCISEWDVKVLNLWKIHFFQLLSKLCIGLESSDRLGVLRRSNGTMH